VYPKKIKETDAIFEHLAHFHSQARADGSVLRVSLDAKAAVAVGPFARRGTSRVHVQAADHDFKPDEVLTPYGIFLPEQAETYLYITPSKLTADFMVDCLRAFWNTVQPVFRSSKPCCSTWTTAQKITLAALSLWLA